MVAYAVRVALVGLGRQEKCRQVGAVVGGVNGGTVGLCRVLARGV